MLCSVPGAECLSIVWPALDLSASGLRAGRQADLIGDSRRCGCIDTEASLAGPASTLPTSQEATLIVGIDVHKHTHAAALIDERGGLIATLSIANSPKGYRQLIDWLVDRQARTR